MIIFQPEKVSNVVTRIYGIAGEQMYLIEGKKRAALVDTGSGVGDLRGYISSLTKLPVTVFLTHGHVDHAMGTPQFDEVYMNALDKEVYKEQCAMEIRKAYLATSARFAAVEDKDYISPQTSDRFHTLRDGDSFDLGGITIEAILCGGHTPGCTMFPIHGEQALVTGDGCNFFTMLQDKSCLGLSTYEQNLKAVRERVNGKYEKVYLSHGRVTPPVTLIDNVLEVCQEIKEGRDDKVAFDFLGTHGYVAKAFGSDYMRIDGGFGNIVYDPRRIWA